VEQWLQIKTTLYWEKGNPFFRPRGTIPDCHFAAMTCRKQTIGRQLLGRKNSDKGNDTNRLY